MHSYKDNLLKQIDDESNEYETLQLIFVFIASFVFFKASMFLTRWYFFKKLRFLTTNFFEDKNKCIKRGVHQLHMEDNRKWRYTSDFISFLHSLLCFILVIIYIVHYFKDDVYFPDIYTHTMGVLFAVICGYILNDTTDLILNEISLRIIILLIHHLLFSLGCLYPIISKKYGGLVIIGLIMEGNSVFLHIRSLLKYNGYSRKDLSYKMVAMFNMLTCILFRLVPNLYMCFYCIINFNNFTISQAIIFCTIIFGLLIINVILTYKLLLADQFIKGGRKSKTPIDDGFDVTSSNSQTDFTSTNTTSNETTTTSTYNPRTSVSSDVKTVILTSSYSIPSSNSNYKETTTTTSSTGSETMTSRFK
uniref:TLC domain-containing protein n=1 Tax=Parastrongyloides trichosuri TaxID=131310 RepID=A0A0N4ZRM2_PARTI